MSTNPQGGGARGRGGGANPRGGARGRGGMTRGTGGGHYPSGPPGPRNDFERKQFDRCRSLNIPYPPDPNGVFYMVQHLKQQGQIYLEANNLQMSMINYTSALQAVELFPKNQKIIEEHHKILCNRSLVEFRLRMYKEAEQDAISAIASCPNFIKGYWRASQAVKGGHNGIKKALPYIINGLRVAQELGSEDDVVTFLTELCVMIPITPITDAMDDLLETIQVPDYNDEDVWTRVVQRLATNNNWESVSMLITGEHSGPCTELQGIGCDLEYACTSISIGSLLKYCSRGQLREWGHNLAQDLLMYGADIDDIGYKMGKPTVHVAVNIALWTADMGLLTDILDQYSTEGLHGPVKQERISWQDHEGRTALHLLVRSGQANTTNGIAILKLLMEYNCDATILDKNNNRAVNYLKLDDEAFKLLLNTGRSVEELRKDLDSLKNKGTDALKSGNHRQALIHYNQALKVSMKSKKLYKEGAVLYSNCANVHFTLKEYSDALTNSIAATNCDISWHKGHYWKAKILYNMGSYHDAFSAYMDGFVKSSVTTDVKFNKFLIEAVVLLKQITANNLMSCYNQLRFLDKDIWTSVLARLSEERVAEWKTIAYLVLGPSLEKGRFGKKVTGDTIEALCSGVAGHTNTKDMTLKSVFTYIHDNNVKKCSYWLDAVLFAVYHHGNTDTLKSLNIDENDTPLHSAVRFALMTGRISLMEEFPVQSQDSQSIHNCENGLGDSVFHTITKLRPLPESKILEKVTELMIKRGLSIMARDKRGKLAVEYLDQKYPGYVFDIFFKGNTKSYSLDDVNKLKDDGNMKFKSGDITAAIDCYNNAINTFKSSNAKAAHAKLTNREIAVLYGNRAEAYLKLRQYQEAFEDSMASVSLDGHWYKAHIRVGKSLRGLVKMEQSMKAFINAYKDIDQSVEDRVKVEILVELATVCSAIPRSVLDIKKRLVNFPRHQGHLWARASYDLVCKQDWTNAEVAFYQYCVGDAKRIKLVYTMQPFCDFDMLKINAWGLDLMHYFLECGSDKKTIYIQKGDQYLHTVVKMTLAVGKTTSLLEYILKNLCQQTYECNQRDGRGNTALHVATSDRLVSHTYKYGVIIILLKWDVDPHIKNNSGHLAVDYLNTTETQSLEVLRMTMYNKDAINKVKAPIILKNTSTQNAKRQPQSSVDQSQRSLRPEPKVSKSCDLCDDLYNQGKIKLKEDRVREGYEKLTELLMLDHRTTRHEGLVNKTVGEIADKLGETATPEIPKCLTCMKGDHYLLLIDHLSRHNKWRQLDALVRKYRSVHGSDQLKGFACSMTVVPVIRDQSLKEDQDLKLQIMCNLLNSQATLGSDDGQTALKSAISEEHYKVVAELIRRGADTTKLSLKEGDTPIHAALVIVLEKERVPSLLEHLLDQFEKDNEIYNHLDPSQVDCHGNCLFHLVAKAKYSTNVLKITELLCKKKLSANCYNNDGKMPVHYVTRKNDRRLQFIRLAATVEATRPQKKGNPSQRKGSKSCSPEDDLQQFSRPDESEHQEVKEVVKIVSIREQRKRKVEELIRILPDSASSIFRMDHSPSKKLASVDEDIRVDSPENVQKMNLSGATKGEVASKESANDVDSDQQRQKVKSDTKDLKSKEDNSSLEKGVMPNKVNKKVVNEKGDNAKLMLEQLNDKAEVVEVKAELLDERSTTEQFKEKADLPEEIATAETKVVDNKVENEEVVEVDNEDREMVVEVEEESESESEDEMDTEDDMFIDVQVFDNLEWEVECTAEVWKTLGDKHVLPALKQRIVRKIQLLACGDWQPHLCKKLKNVPPSLNLFEAKFSKGSRIIWELAVAFSPRCSETAERRLQLDTGETSQAVRGGRIYSEIIRVWEIVLDHDKIHRCVEKIKKSHHRGESCIIQKKLHGIKKSDSTQIPLGAAKRYPMLYAEDDVTLDQVQEHQQEMLKYFPPASANDTEYHILKFYSFTSALVSHVLQNIETKVDFPFRVTDLEHAIINLRSKAPILLLGRSGTGKTTCCLYRLWSQFHSYWTKAKEASAPLLPRCVEFIHTEKNNIDSEDEISDDETSEVDEADDTSAGACGTSCDTPCDQGDEPKGIQYDHVHQLFITKNAVLCSEVQKNFRELSHADGLMDDHGQHEDDPLPSRFDDVGDYAYPLFLTSRQLLVMLDASIGPPYFFERKEDGSLKVDIAGWSDADGPLSILPLLDEDSDDEDDVETFVDEEEELEGAELRQTDRGKKTKVDPRREITYQLFVEEIWPRIKKKIQSYHPSLIWMEIMSFIKGSYEALGKSCGYLTKDEYIKLGKKRAPNFSGERDVVYEFFVRYEHFKKQNALFDETDLVHDAFVRLRQMETRTWVVHQIYVDETQDFTQAELCLLIRLCQNPNDMFLTGDTAQSIMRGIAFRFSDLRSLFYHAKQSMHAMGKTSAVEVPKQVYQLTHNYRSHAGILSLASGILELMVEFFPESFDRLQRDQGLFNGPQPILLESCSFSDLAVLLRGNRRKTSHIEFGAHQAILVVSDAAREAIPEELRLGLVLTIYEAKGLEFDDVLLYNFFKDSQASKEWRVVTDYLERMASDQKESASNQDNLVEIDESILEAKGRPRPLNFDCNQHKVLNSELKHLYTALTRARVNVWIFDEDRDKRAPMFEYFKARKFVKSLTVSEINEESLSETMFAEKSSPSDWVRRGEDFMRHALYRVAAKCFGMGGERDREKVALAHGQALTASRLKDNPKQMREEFLYAAELYLECNKPSKAAICLQNAREMELAAGLFEKLGQYDRAAEVYRKLKRPLASSRCYEQLGNFNKAVEVLYENENYDMAIDTLRRYNMLKQNLEDKDPAVRNNLLNNPPATYHTEEKLSHRAAELFHKYKNLEKMLDALDRFQNVSDKVDFLKNKEYIKQAAKVLEEDGQLESAASLLMMYARIDDALLTAKKTLNEPTIARYQYIACRVFMSKRNKIELPEKYLLNMMHEASELYQSCHDNDGLGEVLLLKAELSKNPEDIKQAMKAFEASKPFENEAGLVECADWMVRYLGFGELERNRVLVRSIGHMFNVCQVLLDPNTQATGEKVRKYDQFYGLSPSSQTTLVLHPREKPLCMGLIADLFVSKTEKKKPQVEFGKVEVHEAIVAYILQRALDWLHGIWNALKNLRDKSRVCEFYQAGLECLNQGNIDHPCLKLHKPQVKQDFKSLIEMDLLLIEYEANVQNGAAAVKKRMRKHGLASIPMIIQAYLAEGERDTFSKFQACTFLWDDLMPAAGHPILIGDDSLDLLKYIRSKDKVHSHLQRYLIERWNEAVKADGDRALRCQAVRESEVFLVFEFGFHLFGFNAGRRRIDPSPWQRIVALESALEKEIGRKGDFKSKERYYTLMTSAKYVECVARRFFDAYQLVKCSKPDPYEAVFKFSKFVILLDQRNGMSFFPEMKHYLMWMEFYITLGIFITAKLKSATFPDFMFILPSNYLQQVKFIEASFPIDGYPIKDTVDWWKPHFKMSNALMNLQTRIKYMGFAISGQGQKVKMLDQAKILSLNDPTNYVLVERLLILCMTLVCNIGKSVPVECEIGLMRNTSHLILPADCPKRLSKVIEGMKSAKGVADVAMVLKQLLAERDVSEDLLVCKWQSGKKIKVETDRLQNVTLFSGSFLNESTMEAMQDVGINVPNETPDDSVLHIDLTEEEIQKGRMDKEAHQNEILRNHSAKIIQSFFRWVLEQRRGPANQEKVASAETKGIDQQLCEITVDNVMCGVCGVYFETKLREQLEYERSTFIGGSSRMNEPTQQSPYPVSPQSSTGPVWLNQAARSPEQNLQPHFPAAANPWGNVTTTQIEPQETTAIKLQQIKENHMVDVAHLQKLDEYKFFVKGYMQFVAPTLFQVKQFLFNPALGLTDIVYRETNYPQFLLEIGRMLNKCSLVEKEMQLLLSSRLWSKTGHIEQNMKELYTDWCTVEPYVFAVQENLRKEEENRSRLASAAPSTTYIQGENWEDELEEIETVVDEPTVPCRTRDFKGRQYRRGRGRGNRGSQS